MPFFKIIKRLMQFQNKKSTGTLTSVGKLLIKLFLAALLLFIFVVLIDKVNLPYPNKIIKKVIPNENFKIVK
tara:strand:- start:1051 stop:1266 length:216 start_codon:yes stop_codon:yes gene_type:complete